MLFALTLMALAACSTTSDGAGDAVPATEGQDEADVFESSLATLPMPVDTHLVVRFDPQQTAHLADLVARQLNADRAQLAGGDVLGQLFPLLLRDSTASRDAAGEVDLRGLDQARPILVAVSSRGNEALLQDLQDGLLPLDINHHYRGLSWRIFLPAADLAQLKSDLESGSLGDPSRIRHVQGHDDYLLVDVHDDHLVPVVDHYGLELDPIDYGAHTGDFWERQTPAQAHFLHHDVAAGLYFKNESLATWAALSSSREAFNALERATADHRLRLLSRGHMMAGDLLRLDGGDVREYEDISLHLTASHSNPVGGQMLRTYTATGAELADKEQNIRTLTRQRLDDPMIDIAWNNAGDLPPGAVDTPQWMAEVLQQESPQAHLSELFRSSGSWPYYIFEASYPRAIVEGLENFPLIGQLPGPMPNVDGIRFATASLQWVKNDASPLGGDLQGHLAVRFHDTPGLRRTVNRMIATMGDLSTESVQLDEERIDDDLLYTVHLGDFESTAETVELDSGHLQVQIHTPPMEKALQNTPMGRHRQIATFLDLLTDLERGTLTYERTDQAVAANFAFGDSPAPSMSVPATDFELAAAEPYASGCLVSVRQQSRAILRNFERLSTPEVDELIGEHLESLEEATAACEGDDADTAQRIYGSWLLTLGNQLVDHDRRASELFEKSCGLGISQACEK